MKTQKGLYLATSALFCGAMLASPATRAQSSTSPAQQAADPNPAGMEEIVVTAQKRLQNINTVGLTITALSGETLKNQQINSLSDLANVIPGLSYTNSSQGTPIYTLRGIGFYEASLAAYPAVAVYLDETPLPFPALEKHSAFDLQRVEVLKGPQGTLFGQNSTGGAINYISAKPTKEFSAGLDVGYGDYNTTIDEAFVSGPLNDVLSARIAARAEHGDGWQNSLSRPDDTNGRVANYMGRILVDFKPSDTIKFELNLNGWLDKSDTQAPQLIGIQWQNPVHDPALANAPFSPETPGAADWKQGNTHANNKFWQAALRGDIGITDDITLTSLSSYISYTQNQADAVSGIDGQITDTPRDFGTIRSISQELRLANANDNPIRWVGGINFEHSTVHDINVNNYQDTSLNATYAQIGYPLATSYNTNDQVMMNYAAFANAEYDILPSVTLKAGARFTRSDRKDASCFADHSGTQNDVGGFLYHLLYPAFSGGNTLGPYTGQCASLDNFPGPNGAAPSFLPGAFHGSLNQSNVSWRVGADWKVADGILVYGNITRGFKAGSFGVLPATVQSQFLPAKQESVLSYEAGFKATLMEHALQLNGAFFYDDYKDKQLRSKVDVPAFGLIDTLENIPESSIRGAELELTASPIRGLTVNATLTYIDATIDKFVGINASGLVADFAGTPIPNTPPWQFGVSADYQFPVTPDWNGFVGGSVNYRAGTVAIIGGNQPPPAAFGITSKLFQIDSYTLVDLRAGVESEDGNWRLQLWGKNIFNQYYFNNVFETYDAIVRFAGMPATYGATLSYRFN